MYFLWELITCHTNISFGLRCLTACVSCLLKLSISLFPQRWKWRWRPPSAAAWTPAPAPRVNLSSPCPSTSQRSIRRTLQSRATRTCLWSTGQSSQFMSGRERPRHELLISLTVDKRWYCVKLIRLLYLHFCSFFFFSPNVSNWLQIPEQKNFICSFFVFSSTGGTADSPMRKRSARSSWNSWKACRETGCSTSTSRSTPPGTTAPSNWPTAGTRSGSSRRSRSRKTKVKQRSCPL